MTERIFVLLAVAIAGGVLLGAFLWYRARTGAVPDSLGVQDFGLELMSGCCAFVVFTSPGCAPCKPTLRIVRETIARVGTPTELVTVDAVEQAEIALRYDVRSVPTTFLITASGHVVGRWRGVPDPNDLTEAALRPVTADSPALRAPSSGT